MEEGSSGSPAVDQTTSSAVPHGTPVHTSSKSTRGKSDGSKKQRRTPHRSGPLTLRGTPRTRTAVRCDSCISKRRACRDGEGNPYYSDSATLSCALCADSKTACTFGVQVAGTERWERWACQSCYDNKSTCVAARSARTDQNIRPCVSCRDQGRICQRRGEQNLPLSDDDQEVATASSFSMTQPGIHSNFTGSTTAALYSRIEGGDEDLQEEQRAASGELSAVWSGSQDAPTTMWQPQIPAMHSSHLGYLANIGGGHNDFDHQPHAANSAFPSLQPSLPSEQEVSAQQPPPDDFGYAGGDNWWTLRAPFPE